jgi:parallel beta-helix repeat protein
MDNKMSFGIVLIITAFLIAYGIVTLTGFSINAMEDFTTMGIDISTCTYNCSDADCVTNNATNADSIICLNQSISGNVTIGANNVTLYCNDFTINGTESASGINSTGWNDTKIMNCVVSNFYDGIDISTCQNCLVYNNTVTNTQMYGIIFRTTVTNSNITDNLLDAGNSILLLFSGNNNIIGNKIFNCGNRAIEIIGTISDNNVVSNNIINNASG